MHDDTQVARVFEMGKVLRNGVFPVRIVPDLGYGFGYPIFNFYAPLAYYIGGIFMLLGFDALVATKMTMALGIVLASVFMYLLAKEFFGKLGGIISGLFYVYAPYHALDIYVRGDVAEFWAYAFIPLAFLGIYKVFENSKLKTQNSKLLASLKLRRSGQFKIQKFGVVGALGFAGIILSHNLTALMVVPFLIVFGLILIIFSKKEVRILYTLYFILYTFLGLTLSAFYWIPAILEMKYTNVLSQIGGGADFRDHFVCISQLWDSLWGFGGSVAGCIDGLSFKIGKLHIIVSLIAIALVFIATRNKNYNSYKYYILLAFSGFVISIFFTLEISKPIWETIPVMAFFQYPWRFLLLASFFSSLIAGSLVLLLSQFKVKPFLIALLLVFILLFFNIKLFNPQTILHKPVADYTSEYALKWTASKISDEYLSPNFKKPKNEKGIAKGEANIKVDETNIEKISNMVSLIGLLAIALGIVSKRKAKDE
ncbi:MAG: hypothetical protein HYW62_01945 [Candidatus Levybacteria bacterium]|nr:hypothetical protein [Candidatus Levybacteria bacterium]